MKAPLRIALTLFSFPALQSWVILIGSVVVGIGIAVRQFELSAVAATFIALHPAMFGGLVLRTMSSPLVLHLRPHGRGNILLGATGTITLVALLETLPVLVFELAGWRTPNRYSVFDLPALGTLQFFWGTTALLWVWAFLASRNNLLFGFTWIPMGTVILLVGRLQLRADQLADAVFVIGVVAWACFAGWYSKTPAVVRPDWLADWNRGQSPIDLGQLLARLRSGHSGANETAVSRPVALCQYLTGTGSAWTQLLTGAVFTVVCAAAHQLARPMDGSVPVYYLLFIPTLFSAGLSLVLVRRARLVWLRAGLDRNGLFATVERHTLRATLAMFSVPVVILVAMSLVQRPELAAQILLFAVTQIVANALFLHAGLTVTRGWNVENVLMFVGLGLLFLVMSIILQPHRGAYVWTYLATIAVFGGLALVLRHAAARAWRTLDWRVAGPLPIGVGQQRGNGGG